MLRNKQLRTVSRKAFLNALTCLVNLVDTTLIALLVSLATATTGLLAMHSKLAIDALAKALMVHLWDRVTHLLQVDTQ
jgi:hypothetical protein